MFCASEKRYLNYLILIAAIIVSRMIFLFFTPYGYYNEEAKIGSIGHDVVFDKGIKLPFWGYLDSPHSGGSIFSGLAAIPFYIIFGDRYLALKITALLFSILTLTLWYKILSSETKYSTETFLFSLIFFTFATPHYVQKSVILAGNTVELMFFNILIIYYFWKMRNILVKNSNYFFLGILCGFSFWVQFMSFYLFLTILLTLFIIERFKIAICHITYLIIGFLFGALPLWIYNFLYHWATFTADPRVKLHFIFKLFKLKSFLFVDLPASFHFLDISNFKAQYLSFFVYGVFIVGILTHLGKKLSYYIKQGNRRRNQNRINITLELFLILYLFVFIIVTSFTQFPVTSDEVPGYNSMNVHAEYYIISLQPIIFALLILLNKYKIEPIFLMNIIVGIIFILAYIGLFRKPFYNIDLLKPMHATEVNSFECGFNFVKNPELFLRFKQKIPYELQVDYIRGAREKWVMSPLDLEKKQILEKAQRLGPDYYQQYLMLNND